MTKPCPSPLPAGLMPPMYPRRGMDESTATPIHYQSPPPRNDDGVTAYLASDRNIRQLEPRHTPPDASLAQDQALGTAEIRKAAEESARSRRRDSAVNTDAAYDVKDSLFDFEQEEIKLQRSSPKLPFRSPPLRIKSELDEQVARAPSSFSSSPRSAARPAVSVESATPPPPRNRSRSSLIKQNDRRASSRRRSARAASRDDLKIDGNALLDPTRSAESREIKLYQYTNGKWYEIDGEGKPEWAIGEKIIFKAAPARRRESNYLRRRD